MSEKRKNSGEEEAKISKFFKRVDEEEADEPKETPFCWSFYETPETITIDEMIRARLAWNDFHEVNMLHFARQTKKGKVNHIGITSYEAHTLIEFVEDIINQMDKIPDLGKPGQALIQFFDNKAPNRPYEHESMSWEAYWKSPDLTLPSIRVRIGMNRRTGMYMLIMNSPVSMKVSAEFHGWQGPQLVFKQRSIKKLLDFLKASIEKSLFEDI